MPTVAAWHRLPAPPTGPYKRRWPPPLLTAPPPPLFTLPPSLSTAATRLLLHCHFIAVTPLPHRLPSSGEARKRTPVLPSLFRSRLRAPMPRSRQRPCSGERTTARVVPSCLRCLIFHHGPGRATRSTHHGPSPRSFPLENKSENSLFLTILQISP
jgi:hypothetical protein